MNVRREFRGASGTLLARLFKILLHTTLSLFNTIRKVQPPGRSLSVPVPVHQGYFSLNLFAFNCS